MKAEGMELVFHVDQMAFMGFIEVIHHLPHIRRVMNKLKELLITEKPDAVVLIDYPGFNLRFAREAKKAGCKVIYYISPQIWAWNKSRINQISDRVDKMLVIFPFEKRLYQTAGIDVEFVGHPLLDNLKVDRDRENFFSEFHLDPKRLTLGLLPGSRKQEVDSLLPVMIESIREVRKRLPNQESRPQYLFAKDDSELQVLVSIAPTVNKSDYEKYLTPEDHITLVENGAYEIMAYSTALVVASGTATLESACWGTPLIVVYKTAWFTWQIARWVVSLPYISLVNILAGQYLVPEILQNDYTPAKLTSSILWILTNPLGRGAIRNQLRNVRNSLGDPGASARAAKSIIKMLN
jgi:lipid-A-disaccharide synthase